MNTPINENLRATIVRRIKALLGKTIENGATEAEAMSAAEKAREMMDKYQVTQTEAELEADGVAQQATIRRKSGRINLEPWIAVAIAEYCDCKIWRQGKNTNIFMGLTGDAEFAAWLLDSLRSFIENETKRYMQTAPRLWDIEKSFMLGCAARIRQRLATLTAERRRHSPVMGDGRALVVVKGAIVERAFGTLGLHLRSAGKSKHWAKNPNAYAAGIAAGDRANLNRPVNGTGQTNLLR